MSPIEYHVQRIIDVIKELQRELRVPDDGIWGPVSNEALREFYKSTGVNVMWK